MSEMWKIVSLDVCYSITLLATPAPIWLEIGIKKVYNLYYCIGYLLSPKIHGSHGIKI